ncbi:MAG: hypothetical protein KAJ18_11640 [Candidatus Omnitrophica bacterium]|nr:hypothetical protein [Candidatus Omnitrophota bacterium]
MIYEYYAPETCENCILLTLKNCDPHCPDNPDNIIVILDDNKLLLSDYHLERVRKRFSKEEIFRLLGVLKKDKSKTSTMKIMIERIIKEAV